MNNHSIERRLEKAQAALLPAEAGTGISLVAQCLNVATLQEATAWAKVVGALSVAFVPLDGPVQQAALEPPANRSPMKALAFEGGEATPNQLEAVAALGEPAFARAAAGEGLGFIYGGGLSQFVCLSRESMEAV